MTMRSFDLSNWIPALTIGCALTAGCDLGSKSVTATASDSNGDDGGGSEDGASDDVGADGVSATSQGDGGSSPGDGGDGFPHEHEPTCLDVVTQILDPAELTPLGFSADDIIALSDGWSTTFEWAPADGLVTVVPAGTETQLDIGLTYTGGWIQFVDSEPNPDNHNDIVPDCPDRLELELDISFHTLDERFDETFTTMAYATAPELVEFRQVFEPDGFAGSFSSAEVTFGEDDGIVRGFELMGSFAAEAEPIGTLYIEVEQSFGGPGDDFVAFGVIAGWPDALMGL